MNNFIVLDKGNGINQYHVDIRAAAQQGFSDWYEEAVFFNTDGCTFSFYREGTLVGFIQY